MEGHELNKKQITHLFDMLLLSANQLGFGSVSFSEVGITKKQPSKAWHVFWGNYSSHWVNRYTDNDYAAIDPVAQVVPFSDVTVDWGVWPDCTGNFLPKLPDLV